MIPDRLLTPIDGASFRRAGTDPHDASVGGRYDHQAHTVTIYDPGMRQTTARFGDGSGAVGPRLRTILHELGHAIDEAPLHSAWTARETARQAFESAFSQYDSRRRQLLVPPQHAVELQPPPWRRHSRRHRLHASPLAVRARLRARRHPQLRHRDRFHPRRDRRRSVTLTAYAESTRGEDHHLRETYAEAFSMFITEPQTLRSLRPNVHAYFAGLGAPRRGR